MKYFLPLLVISCIGFWTAFALRESEPQSVPDGSATRLVVTHTTAPLLEHPTEGGAVLAKVVLGDTLLYQNQLSEQTLRYTVNGVTLIEPWLRVKTTDGKKAWIWGGYLQTNPLRNAELTKQWLVPRLEHFFGKRLAERINEYNMRFDRVTTYQELASVHRSGKGLCDSLQGVITRRVAADSTEMPNMFWLNGLIRGVAIQLSLDKTRYFLGYDYALWERHAYSTQGAADEEFMRAMRAVFTNGIQYPSYSWQIAQDHFERHMASRLGSGKHLEVLRQLNAALESSKYFEKEVLSVKTQLMNDITEETAYANSMQLIDKEIIAILTADLMHIIKIGDQSALLKRTQTLRTASGRFVAQEIAKSASQKVAVEGDVALD